MTNKIEDDVRCNDQTGSQLNDEDNRGSVGGIVLKKGPWTSAEDAILVDYVKKHGEGNWNAVQKHLGLSRCGKSCRLRWANHLRPNLKKGTFTAEEEHLIAELHAKMGNKWARMAAHRCQRAGLPLYPPDVCLQAFQESQDAQGTDGINDGDRGHHDILLKNNHEIHDAIFNNLKENRGILPFVPELPDISANRILLNSLGSPPYCNFVPSTLPNHNHLQESTMSFLGSSGTNRNGFYPFDQIQDNTSDKIAQSFGLQSPLDPGLSSHNSFCYSQSVSNGNSSTSRPTSQAVKLELPSLQYPETDFGSRGTSPPAPLNESVDVFNQSPLPPGALELDFSSPHNSGLLDALLYQAKTLTCSKNNYLDKSSNSSTATPGDRAESSALNLYEGEWEDYADPVSPFGATSILNGNHAVSTNGNSWDKWTPVWNFSGNHMAFKSIDQLENQAMSLLNITWPDVLLASDWHEQFSEHGKNRAIKTEASDDLVDYMHITGETYSSSTRCGF